MSPWTVLGWIIVGVVVISLTLLVIGIVATLINNLLIPYIKKMKLHLQTRNTPPSAGQRWVQNDSILRIDRVTDEGRIVIHCMNAGWSDDPVEWKRRVKNNKMYLIKPRKTT